MHRFRDHERECSDGSWDLRAIFYFPKASFDSNFAHIIGTGQKTPRAKVQNWLTCDQYLEDFI
jgi:hypothetical protein